MDQRYQYDFAFLSPSLFSALPASCGSERRSSSHVGLDDQQHARGRIVFPLYKHVFHARYPSLAFVGIPFKCIPFLCFDLQAHWIEKVFTGKSDLPSKEDMQRECHQQVLELKHDLSKFHQLGQNQVTYYNELAALVGGGMHVNPIIHQMYDDTAYLRRAFPMSYRNAVYTADFDHQTWTRTLIDSNTKTVFSASGGPLL